MAKKEPKKIDAETIQGYLRLALAEKTCLKHPIGVVIETPDKNYILGWNGPPTRGKESKRNYCNRADYASGEGMHLCTTVHAEIKAIAHAAKHGVKLEGSTIYMNEWFPCSDCGKALIEAGIERLVTPDEVYANKETHELVEKLRGQTYLFEMSESLIRGTGIEIIVDPSIRLEKA